MRIVLCASLVLLPGCAGHVLAAEAAPNVKATPAPTEEARLARLKYEARQRLYLDPSDENRSLVTRWYLDASGLLPGDVDDLVSELDGVVLGERSYLLNSRGKGSYEQYLVLPMARQVALPMRTRIEAEREITRAMQLAERCADPCNRWWCQGPLSVPVRDYMLYTLLFGSNRSREAMERICASPSEEDERACRVWAVTKVAQPREEMLRALLTSDNHDLTHHGFGQVFGRLDPRDWDPTDLAVAIVTVRPMCEEASRLEAARVQELPIPSHAPTLEGGKCSTFRAHLVRMGVKASWLFMGTGREYPDKLGPYLTPHFEKEQLLLEWEWLAPRGFSKVQEARRLRGEKWLEAEGMYEHVFRRWEEIDSAAPRPDTRPP